MENISAPSYYVNFSCIGPDCEDTCCSGWMVSIDSATYDKYDTNTHPDLAPLFRLALKKNPDPGSDNDFGFLAMKPDGACHFQQEDRLCAIQKNLGAPALSTTCKLYPRYINQFGAQREHALGISCPEAARLVLLNPEPMQFQMFARDAAVDDGSFTSYRFPMQGDGDPAQIAVLNDFRAVIVGILQYRDLSLGARMMLLGVLLEEADKVVTTETFVHASELSPVLSAVVGMLARPAVLQAQFEQIPSNMSRKLAIVTSLTAQLLEGRTSVRLRECLLAAVEGLDAVPTDGGAPYEGCVEKYLRNYQTHYLPFFQDKQYIFENYLVNQVVTRLFPFTRGTYLELYRELTFRLSALTMLLVGMAAKHEGLDERLVVQLFQSFARKVDHNGRLLGALHESFKADSKTPFFDVMWLLKEA